MKIKRSHLVRLIKEELSRVLNEANLERTALKLLASKTKYIYELGLREDPTAEGRFELSFDVEDSLHSSGVVNSVMTNVEIGDGTHDTVKYVGEYFVNRPFTWRGSDDVVAPVTPGSYTFNTSMSKVR